MNPAIAHLTPEHRLDVEGRLARYGLNADQHMTGGLTVPRGATLALSSSTRDAGTHLVLRTRSIDQMKAWIGVPDAVFAQQQYAGAMPGTPLDATRPREALSSEDWQTLFHAARAYVWGNSQEVSDHGPALEAYLGDELGTDVHVYTTLNVNGTLTFNSDQGAVVLLANTINFGPGGQILANGVNVTVNSTVINSGS